METGLIFLIPLFRGAAAAVAMLWGIVFAKASAVVTRSVVVN